MKSIKKSFDTPPVFVSICHSLWIDFELFWSQIDQQSMLKLVSFLNAFWEGSGAAQADLGAFELMQLGNWGSPGESLVRVEEQSPTQDPCSTTNLTFVNFFLISFCERFWIELSSIVERIVYQFLSTFSKRQFYANERFV